FPPELALHLCTEVAHALHHAHTSPARIVRRDVSPQNILDSWTGDVKLTDFGIAFAKGRIEKTTAGVTKGKPSYMAPEQATRGDVDARTDVFALGCVLHALITGKSPLAGEDKMADLLTGIELPLLSLPDDVGAIVARAVKRSKHERFASAAEMAAACGRALATRLDRDARSVLRDFIAAVRPAPEPTQD